MNFLQSVFFGLLFGYSFQTFKLVKDHKKRLNRIEDFLFGEVIAKDEANNK